jgi:hypothetical protein
LYSGTITGRRSARALYSSQSAQQPHREPTGAGV